MKRIRLMGLADGSPHEYSGSFVVSYDPEYHCPDGSYDGGALITTMDPHEAGRFTFEEAMMLWRAAPTCECHRLRRDGAPNRPLTAFNIEVT